jgi:hypothetical protein
MYGLEGFTGEVEKKFDLVKVQGIIIDATWN